MSIINRVKQHISDNRGKYGAAAGAGAMYGASKIDSPLLNQAGFNVLAKGQNLALDVADKIGYGKEQLQNLGMREIDPKAIDLTNAIANIPGVSLKSPLSGVTMAEKFTAIKNGYDNSINKYNEFSDNLDNKVSGYIDQGVNYVKGLNPFTENTISITIKNMLLEGYTPEEITEGIIRNNAMNSFDSNNNYVLDGSGRIIGLLPFGMIPGAIMGGIAGYKVGTHGKTGAGAAVGALIGKNGAMGALSTEDDDIRLRDIYRPKNIAINAAHGTLGGAAIGGLTGGPVGALGGAAIGGTLGMVGPAIQYGIGKAGGKAGNYFSK